MERPNTKSKFEPINSSIQTLTEKYTFIDDYQARQLLSDALLLKTNGDQGKAFDNVNRILQTISKLSPPELNARVREQQLVEQRPGAAAARYVPNPLTMEGGYKMSRKSKAKMSRKSKAKMSRKSKAKMSRKFKAKMSRKSKVKMSRKSKVKKMSRKKQ